MDNEQRGFAGFLEQLLNGIWRQNPTLVLLLGMCPTLAVSTSLENALGMGLSTMFVLVLSNLVISLLRRFIPPQIRIASYVIIIAGFVTAIDLLLQAYLPDLSASLGIFIPLIVVNCIIFARAEAFASKNPPLRSAIDGLSMGAGFTLALSLMAVVREIVGGGTILGYDVTFGIYQPIEFFIKPAGGFFMLGLLIAAVTAINSHKSKKANKEGAK